VTLCEDIVMRDPFGAIGVTGGRRHWLVTAGCALLVLGGSGCTGSQRRGDGGEPLLWVQVQALGQGLRPLKVGEALRGGERFGLLVESPEARSLQLALVAPPGPGVDSTPTLWPQEDQPAPRLEGGRPVNIPGATQWFRAEPRPGQGSLVLVVTKRPLAPGAVWGLLNGSAAAPLAPRVVAKAATARGRDPGEWYAFSLPADVAVVRVPLPQR
jgi:hypothetical protein